MFEKQCSAPLFEALLEHASGSPAGFHIPGHCRGQGLPEELAALGGQALFSLDMTELPGLDDLHNPGGPIALAQELAAELYGAGRSFFLVNGTTVGIQALLAAYAGQGEVIVPRNAHRSVLGGLIVSGADPYYVMPEVIPEFGADCGVPPAKILLALEERPGAAAVIVVRPNYYGVAGDLPGQVHMVHEAGRLLLADEAHGAHLRFHRDLPQDAMSAGADASVQSTHKLGGSLGQSSMLHLKHGVDDGERVAVALQLLQTTSPSYILMGSLDLARRQMALRGEQLLERTLELARWLRKRLSQVRGLSILSQAHLRDSSLGIDPAKLVISVQSLGLTGYQVEKLLARRYNVFVEMADAANIVAVLSIGTTFRDCESLASAMEDIAARERQPAKTPLPGAPGCYKKVMKPREAWFLPSRGIPLAEAGGMVSAETVAVYPPGIPVLGPGEEITPDILEYLTLISDMGLPCQGPYDRTLKTIKVVIE